MWTDQCSIRVKATCINPFKDASCPVSVGMLPGGAYRYMTTGITMLLFAMGWAKDYDPTDDRRFLSLLSRPAYRLIRDYESGEIVETWFVRWKAQETCVQVLAYTSTYALLLGH
jgi:hypothetical protein